MEMLSPSGDALRRAAEALRAGEVVAYPTETVYGLGVDPFQPEALERLFEVKGRETSNAILVIVSGADQLHRVAEKISERAKRYMDAFWPGPLSLLFPRHPALPEAVAPGRDTICVRCPGSPWARGLCEAFGGPVTSTSANRSGEPPVHRLEELKLEGVSIGIDDGPIGDGIPSTILDPESGTVLREGAITEDALRRAGLGK